MNRSVKALLLGLVLISSACSERIPMEIPDYKKQVVVNSLFTQEGEMTVNLSHNFSYYKDPSEESYNPKVEFIQNAQVELWENGEFVENLKGSDKGIYKSEKKNFGFENTYELRVKAPDFLKEVKAETYMPVSVPIDSISFELKKDGSFPFYELTVYFTDTNGNDYYYVSLSGSVMKTYKDENDKTHTAYYDLDMQYNYYSSDPVFGSESLNLGRLLTFSDELFSNSQYPLKIRIDNDFKSHIGYFYSKLFLIVNLCSVSKDFYLYGQSYNKQDPGDVGQYFLDPLKMHSNVNNGLGIFAGIAVTKDSIEVKN